ncbi:hypothetical protein GH733_019061 [Mirounga leonina]|nr:hypothetical protein GH733_019061 [Mirounga leonina]
MRWILGPEILRMRGTISREHSPSVLSDLYFHRNPEEIEEYTAAKKAANQEEFHGERISLAPEFTATKLEVAAVSAGRQVPSVPASGSLPKTGASSPLPPLKTGLQPRLCSCH